MKYAIILIILIAFIPPTLFAQEWTSIGPDGFADCTVMALDPSDLNSIYIGTANSGVFRSEDGGDSWQYIGIAEERIRNIELFAKNENLIAVVADGLHISHDAGKTWNLVYDPLLNSATPMSVSILSSDGDTLLLGTNMGIYKTYNGGIDWLETSRELDPFLYVPTLVADPLSSNVIYAGAASWLYKSIDSGESWQELFYFDGGSHEAFIEDIAFDPNDTNRIAVATKHAGVHLSTDRGNSWNYIGFDGNQTHSAQFSGSVPSLIYVAGAGTWRTNNDGGEWVKIDDRGVESVRLNPENSSILYSATRFDGVIRSVDGGLQWSEINSGLHAAEIREMLAAPDREGMFFIIADETFYYSEDWADQWQPRNNGLPNFPGSYLALSSDPTPRIYAGRIYYTDNFGIEWSKIDAQLPYLSIRAMITDPDSPETLILGSSYAFEGNTAGVFKSIDGGITWEALTTGLVPSLMVSELARDPLNNSTIYISGNEGTFRSLNNGETWEPFSSGLSSDVYVNEFAFDTKSGNKIYAATTSGVYFRSFEDAVWHKYGLDEKQCLSITLTEGLLFVATLDGIFMKIVGKEDWNDFGEKLPYRKIRKVTSNLNSQGNMIIYAGTYYGGIFETVIENIADPIGDSHKSQQISSDWYLAAAFPNPFNPATTISFVMQKAGKTRLVVYDLLGKEVARLVDGVMDAGTHTATWNASNFPSGIYFYRLQAGDFVQTRKMVLLK